jgi:hypothetical protein
MGRKAWKETCRDAPVADAAMAYPKVTVEKIDAQLHVQAVRDRAATIGADEAYPGAEGISFALFQALPTPEM